MRVCRDQRIIAYETITFALSVKVLMGRCPVAAGSEVWSNVLLFATKRRLLRNRERELMRVWTLLKVGAEPAEPVVGQEPAWDDISIKCAHITKAAQHVLGVQPQLLCSLWSWFSVGALFVLIAYFFFFFFMLLWAYRCESTLNQKHRYTFNTAFSRGCLGLPHKNPSTRCSLWGSHAAPWHVCVSETESQ